jgi:two-component system, NarL family, response regulator DevR
MTDLIDAPAPASPAPAPPISVFLVDDHEVVRWGVRGLLEASGGIEIVGEATTASEAMRRIPALRPRVALLDLRLPDGNGVEVCREIRSHLPETSCIILTSYCDDDARFDAITAGACGYLLKGVRGVDLVDAVQHAAMGDSMLSPTVVGRALARLRNPPHEDERMRRLTQQERKVLSLIADSRTNREIADELNLAEKTIKNYVSNMLMKLGMERRIEAAVYATRLADDQRHARETNRWSVFDGSRSAAQNRRVALTRSTSTLDNSTSRRISKGSNDSHSWY